VVFQSECISVGNIKNVIHYKICTKFKNLSCAREQYRMSLKFIKYVQGLKNVIKIVKYVQDFKKCLSLNRVKSMFKNVFFSLVKNV
jgi:hypothetical protein